MSDDPLTSKKKFHTARLMAIIGFSSAMLSFYTIIGLAMWTYFRTGDMPNWLIGLLGTIIGFFTGQLFTFIEKAVVDD